MTKEPQVDGITRSDFLSWKHHPVTKLVWRFLSDKRAFISEAAINQWIDGSLSLQADQTLRGQIIELHELESMEFEALAAFYANGEGENIIAAEIGEHEPGSV